MMIIDSITTVTDIDHNPDRDPGITITVTGRGNNLVILATENLTGDSIIIPGTGNGIFTQVFSAFGYTGIINIKENSLCSVNITKRPEVKKLKM